MSRCDRIREFFDAAEIMPPLGCFGGPALLLEMEEPCGRLSGK